MKNIIKHHLDKQESNLLNGRNIESFKLFQSGSKNYLKYIFIAKSLLLTKSYKQTTFHYGTLFKLGVFLGIETKHYEELQQLDKIENVLLSLDISLDSENNLIKFIIQQPIENTTQARVLFVTGIKCNWFNGFAPPVGYFDLMIHSPIEVAVATLKAAQARMPIKISARALPLTNKQAMTCARFVLALFNASRDLKACSLRDLEIIPDVSVLAKFALSQLLSSLLIHKNELRDCVIDFGHADNNLFICGNIYSNNVPKLILTAYRKPLQQKYDLVAVPSESFLKSFNPKNLFQNGSIVFDISLGMYSDIIGRLYDNNSSLSVKDFTISSTGLSRNKIDALKSGMLHSTVVNDTVVVFKLFDIYNGDCLVSLTADFTLALEKSKIDGIIEIPDEMVKYSIDNDVVEAIILSLLKTSDKTKEFIITIKSKSHFTISDEINFQLKRNYKNAKINLIN